MDSIISEKPVVDLNILESRVGVACSIPIDSAMVEIHSLILFFSNLRSVFNICVGLGHCKFITYIASAKRAAAIGIEGKWAIHPSQIDLANKVFSPQEAEVNKAKRIIEELDKAAKEGKGAAQLDGRMIDAASARMAENIVNINKLIENK